MSPSQQTACRAAASVAVLALTTLVAFAIIHPRAPAWMILITGITSVVAVGLAMVPLTLRAAARPCPRRAASVALAAGLLCLLASSFGLGLLAGHAGWTSVIVVR